MSGAQTQLIDREDPPRTEVDGVNPETERIARLNGWKPRSELPANFDDSRWIPADVFVARGLEVPAILANRNKALTAKVDDLQRQIAESERLSGEKLDAAIETVNGLTTMVRTSEQRAYERARRELKEDMEKAVETGDTATWRRLDLQREELESTKPLPTPTRTATTTTTQTPPQQQRNGNLDPAVQRFFADNRWYDPERKRDDRDDEMMAFADTIHNGLRTTRPDLSMEQNLGFVVMEVKNRFPDRFGGQRAAAADPDPATRQNNNNGGGGGDRRNDPPAVTPSSGSPGPRRNTNRFTFDTMPQISKDNYARYAKVLEGKGKPLTKEEWATDYWAQYQDDGNP